MATPAALSRINTAEGELGHWWPEVLPGDRMALFTIWRAGSVGLNDARIGVLDLQTGAHRSLMPGSMPKFVAPDRLLYFHAGAYHLIGFDPVTVETRGEAARVLAEAVPLDPLGTRHKPVSIAANGTIAYLAGALFGEHKLGWLERGGTRIVDLDSPAQTARDIQMSPDGRTLAVERLDHGELGLWLYDLHSRTQDRLAIPGSAFTPVWSADSRTLAFGSLQKGHFDVHVMRLDDRVPRPLIAEPFDQLPTEFTHDGQRLLIVEYSASGTVAAVARVASPGERTRMNFPAGESVAQSLSPDDRWLAVETTASGRPEIVVYAFPNAGAPITVSRQGGTAPLWSARASELIYRRGDDIVAVTYRDDSGRFTVVKEQTVATARNFWLAGVTPDGRFLVGRDVNQERTPARVVLDWVPDAPKR